MVRKYVFRSQLSQKITTTDPERASKNLKISHIEEIVNTFLQACKQEIIELHEFFEDWFTATIKETDENFSRFEKVLDDKFILITPSGEKLSREEILTFVEKAYGLRREVEPPYSITILNVHCAFKTEEYSLCQYEEWQKIGDKETARISSVLFQRCEGLPNRLKWIFVHETWLPGKSP